MNARPWEGNGSVRVVDDPPPRDTTNRCVDGAAFVLDGPVELEPRWGTGDQVLWPRGEALIAVSPPGVGKTTIAVQLVGSMAEAFGAWVLGYPVLPARKILYLAMDRPRQIRRAMRRCFTEEHRAVLRDRLVVRPGPLPVDVARDPGILLRMAQEEDVDVIVLDSLKDTTAKIADDEAGSQLNRAMQLCLAEGIDILALHHQRKGQNGDKPKTLEDVYGSTWITAGAGSVILLWGKAGDPLVELHHLKQPAGEVGPLKIEHDHLAGRSTVYRGFDALAFLRLQPTGATVMEVSRAMFEKPAPTDAERIKAQRRLDGLVKHGLAVKDEAKVGGDGGSIGARYRSSESLEDELRDLVG